jgi:Crinkler effector protein N-terminal domain
MAEMYTLWCYIRGDSTHFPVIVSPTISIGVLQLEIKEVKSNLLQRVDPSSLTLSKVRYF